MATSRLLFAAPGMDDPTFGATVVFLFETSPGVAGVILNRPSDITVESALPDIDYPIAPPGVVFHGGPVQTDRAIVLANVGDRIELINDVPDQEYQRTRVFAGYAGWGPGQLEDEFERGGWYATEPRPDDVFTADPLGLWRQVFARQDSGLRRYRTYPDDPSLN